MPKSVFNAPCSFLFAAGLLLCSATSYAGGGNYARLYKVYGPDYLSRQGFSQDALGDINNDGNPDFIVGDITKGKVILYSGKNGQEIASYSGFAGAAGVTVANLQDIDGDGVDDYAYGDPRANGGAIGSAYVYSGRTRSLLRTYSGTRGNWDLLGSAIASIGDVNNDMVPDYLISADTDKLSIGCGGGCVMPVRVYSGLFGNELYSVWPAGSHSNYFGTTVQRMGDMNGDGIPDFAVSDPASAYGVSITAGITYFYSGSNGATITYLNGSVDWGWFGYAIEVLGDLNGDGYREFAIGSPNRASDLANKGYVNIYSGNRQLNFPLLFRLYGDTPGARFGYSIASLPDINDDGVEDFMVGAPLEDKGSKQDVGKISFFSGADGSLLFPIYGTTSKGNFGHSLKHAFSIDGNGKKNVIAGQANGVDQIEMSNVQAYALASTVLIDTDGDEVPNDHDLFPNDFNQSGDLDGDGLDNIVDGDDDGDGVPDTLDASQYGGSPYETDPLLPLDGSYKGGTLRESSALDSGL